MDIHEHVPLNLMDAFDKAVYIPGRKNAQNLCDIAKDFLIRRDWIKKVNIKPRTSYLMFWPDSFQIMYTGSPLKEQFFFNRMKELEDSATATALRARGFLLGDFLMPLRFEVIKIEASSSRSDIKTYEFIENAEY